MYGGRDTFPRGIADCHAGGNALLSCFGKKVSKEPTWGATRPPPVAESREGSEWPRSADDAAAPSARNMPSIATGKALYDIA